MSLAVLPSVAMAWISPAYSVPKMARGMPMRPRMVASYNDDDDVLLTEEERAQLRAAGGDLAGTYGEITAKGFAELGKRLRLGPDDVFVDVGSGFGAVAVQAARDFGVRQSYGVEYAASRHNKAVANLARGGVSEGDSSRVRLIQADATQPNLWTENGELSSSTCVYTCNKLFNEELNNRLRQRLESCPTIQRIAAFTPWPEGLDGFDEPCEILCETTWSQPRLLFGQDIGGGSPVYIYQRRSGLLPKAAAWWTGELEGMAIVVAVVAVSSILAGGTAA
jgi:hypothetical protein